MSRYSLYPASIVHAGGTLHLTQLEGQQVNPGSNVATFRPGGLVDPSAFILTHAEPTVTMTTRDIATVLGTISISSGVAISAESTFRFQERAESATFVAAATATHEVVTIQEGFIAPTSISASQDDDGATVELTCWPTWDGTNLPIIHDTGVAISATAPAFVASYFLGPVYHNSSQISGVTSIRIDPGITYSAVRYDGDPYARDGAIVMREPQITVTIAFLEELGDITSEAGAFLRALDGTFACYLKKGVESGARTATDAGDSIKISCTTGAWSHDDMGASGTDDGTLSFTTRPTSVLSFSAASNIP